MTLSASGSSVAQLQAGLVLAPLDPAAGGRLAAAVKRLVRGLPISATTSGGHVLVTYGYRSIMQLLHPTAQLAGDPAFKRALAQLPPGASASVYLNFGPVALLSALDRSAGDAAALRVLHRLDYLIAGGTHSHFRLVLAAR